MIVALKAKLALAALAAVAGGTYAVHQGDTLSSIAAAHGESLQQIEADNPQITDPDFITVGELIHLGAAQGGAQQPQQQSPAVSPASVPAGDSAGIPAWATCIVERESGGNPRSVNAIPGYIGNGGGLFGDLTATWNNYGGYAEPFQAPVSVQIAMNNQLSDNGANLRPWQADRCPGTGG